MAMPKKVLSLFSSAGIGEAGIIAAGMDILVSNELLPTRCALYRENYPTVQMIEGDIWSQEETIIEKWIECSPDSPYLVYATPPCQGMSSNGAGKLLHETRNGNRKGEDQRNRLIIPTMHIVKALRPVWLLLENVPTMDNTVISDESGNFVNIISYIQSQLGNEYIGKAEVVNCADYGIPQTRRRLITVFTRSQKGKDYFKKHGSFLPERTHSELPTFFSSKWVSLRETIGSFPPLSAKKGENSNCAFNEWHFVPVMTDEKYWWMDSTPEGNTAYNNQCTNPQCLFQGNRLHGSNTESGFHQSNTDTPIYCERCGQLLPRPSILDKKTGKRRLIKGYDTAYRRMEWDKPAPTLTQNFLFEASDKKVHPSQTRVLSLFEAMVIQTINRYPYRMEIDGKPITKNMCAEVIGESVPPLLIELICRNMLCIDN